MATRALMQNVKIDAVNNDGISPPDHLRSINFAASRARKRL